VTRAFGLTVVVGVIGVMQALEVIKIIVHSSVPSPGQPERPAYRPSMTMFAAFDSPQWRTFRLRSKKVDCVACGHHPSITADSIQANDYSALCKRVTPAEIAERVSVQEYSTLREQDHILVDVRDQIQFEICSLPNSKNIPFTSLLEDAESCLVDIPRKKPVFVVCRYGNDSQVIVKLMKELKEQFAEVKDIKGGLDAWADTFPSDVIPKY